MPAPLFHLRSGAVFAVAVAAVAAFTTGCASASGTSHVEQDVAVVLAATSGSTAFQSATLDEAFARLTGEGDRIVVVEADGTPYPVLDQTLPQQSGNSRTRADDLARFRSAIEAKVATATSRTPEIDLAGAIDLAAGSFRPGADHLLIVLGSGVSTAGALDLRDGRLYADPVDLVAHVSDEIGLPDLSGAEVVMPQIAVATSPQPDLAPAHDQLRDIWSQYFTSAGATDVRLDTTDMVARAATADRLPVTPIDVDRPTAGPAVDCHLRLSDATIGFQAGSADLVDPAATSRMLAQAVAGFANCPGTYTVEGSASSEGSEETNSEISTARAQRVAELLSDVTGVPVAQMTVTGWGEHWPCRVQDEGPDGELLLAAAMADRVVAVARGDATC